MNYKVINAIIIGVVIFIGCSFATEKKKDQESLSLKTTGFVSAYVVDLDGGNVMVDHNSTKRLTPASLTKVFTSSAALDLLKPDFRFETQFFMTSGSSNRLLIKGGGDPTLGSDRWDMTKPEKLFSEVLSTLQKNKIKSVEGIVLDLSLYGAVKYPSKRNWEDMANYYGAPPSALTFKENTFYMTLSSPDKVGEKCKVIKCDPAIDKQIDCFVLSSAVNKDSAYIYGYPDMDRWYVSGSIPAGRKSFKIKGALPNPEQYFAQQLKAFLINKGIEVNGKITYDEVKNFPKVKLVHQHYSPSLSEIVTVINKRSHNLFADHLFLQMAISQNKGGNWDDATKELEAYWTRNLPNMTGRFYDGSGLSPFNRFSASDMVGALQYINSQSWSDVFKQSLSVAGQDGTLKSLFNEGDSEGLFIGKSGSMEGVLCYCGYVTTKSGKQLVLCIMVNGFTETYKELRGEISDAIRNIINNN